MSINLLRKHFPLLRTRDEIVAIIEQSRDLHMQFCQWTDEQQEEFLRFCIGERGVKILYDSFFKEIFNPEYAPERLERLLSLIMQQTIRIIEVLPNDTTRLAGETSLLTTDIVVELADHSIANIEIQKIGYMFPGQRCACYSADLLLRQYKRLHSKYKKNFSYKNVKNVYTIIFFERSTAEFKQYSDKYLHYFSQCSNTGLELDAWLTFLSIDEPAIISELVMKFPQFKPMYEDIYELCQNIERVMNMFSKELNELDKNTVQYMIDVMQDEIDDQKLQLKELNIQMNELDTQIKKQDMKIKERESQIQEQHLQIKERESQIQEQHRINQLYKLLSEKSLTDDLQKAVLDEDYRQKLMMQYAI